jgi:hypothetical protein
LYSGRRQLEALLVDFNVGLGYTAAYMKLARATLAGEERLYLDV